MESYKRERKNILGNNVTPEDLARLLEGGWFVVMRSPIGEFLEPF
jgi:hypothetical protein